VKLLNDKVMVYIRAFADNGREQQQRIQVRDGFVKLPAGESFYLLAFFSSVFPPLAVMMVMVA